MGGLAAGGRVGLKIAACFTAITPEHCLHCSAFIFAATTESREKRGTYLKEKDIEEL